MTSAAVFLNGQAKDAGERRCLRLLGGADVKFTERYAKPSPVVDFV